MGRREDIEAAVAAAEVDIDRMGTQNAFATLSTAHALVDTKGIAFVLNAYVAALKLILGDAFPVVFGDDPKPTELIMAVPIVLARLDAEMQRLAEMIADLTTTAGD